MSTATLNIWITEFSDPCHIMGQHIDPTTAGPEQWYVHIVDCEGNPLVWCGKRYTYLPAECGHLEVEVPPGCYAIFAGHSPNPGNSVNPELPPTFGNRLTHIQVVRANCCDHVCVTLFSPDMWHCGTWFHEALRAQAAVLATAGVEAKLVTAATDAVQAVLDKVKPHTTQFAQNLERFKADPPKEANNPPQDTIRER